MRLLDLFCGAGGAGAGYAKAGFETVGVDLKPQRHYPFEFVQGDALEYLAEHGHEFDAIHASPPCQGYSIMHNLPWLRDREYPLLILPTMTMLNGLGKPYVLENVMGARHGSKTLKMRGLEAHGLEAGWLCGAMFGRPFFRHRLFATNWLWLAPEHPNHRQYGRVTTGGSDQEKGRGVSEQIVSIPVGGYTFDPYYDSRRRQNGPEAGRVGDKHIATPKVQSTQEKPHGEDSLHHSVHVTNPVNSGWQQTHSGRRNRNVEQSDGYAERVRSNGKRGEQKIGGPYGLNLRPGYEHNAFNFPTLAKQGVTDWQNSNRAQGEGVGIGHAVGWRLAAEAMGIDWMNRDELTQAVPPRFTEHIGGQLMAMLRQAA